MEVTIAPENFGKAEKALGKKVLQAITRRVIKEASPGVLSALRRKTVEKRIAHKYRFALGWSVKSSAWHTATVYNKAKHAIYVEGGRRPGKRPPMKVIEQWLRYRTKAVVSRKNVNGVVVRKRGGRSSMKTQQIRTAAFLIARAIGRRGIKPRRVLTDPSMRKRIKLAFQKRMAEHYETAIAIVYRSYSGSRG